MQSNQLDEKDIFNDARTIGSPEARAAYIQQVCGDDPGLVDRINALVQGLEKRESFLESPPPGVGPATADQPPLEQPGTQIGPYKLLQVIGEGGMGIVYMAEQREPVVRQVALKIIKLGMDTHQVIARFEAERQALAMMDHSNISKVLDAGTTDSGRPYFAMELVRGVPITEYCDQQRLAPHERLELFLPVCRAVQHAHQKGIIHRDIKPSNIMVAIYDGQPVPKVIDFGVAKATGQRLTEKTLFTHFGQIIGTLEYMSPEQARLDQLDIDTRSDIYSLGVLLYELLTGGTPFDPERLRSTAFDEVMQIIREEVPPRPSSRLSNSDTLPTVAANRQIEPKKLQTLVRGELDWIVMKALDKDRSRRYETASGLAEDIGRYLKNEPVEACPPSVMYRFRTFARRNQTALATTGAVLLMVVAGLAVSTVLIARERAEAVHQRDVAEAAQAAEMGQRQAAEENLQKTRQAVDRLFTRAAENLAGVPQMTEFQGKLFEDALEFYQEFLEEKSTDPEIRRGTALAYYRVGGIYVLLGRHPEAEGALRGAIALQKNLSDEFPSKYAYREDLAESYEQLRRILMWAGRYEEIIEVESQRLAICEGLAADLPGDGGYQRQVAVSHYSYGISHMHFGRGQQAEQHYRQSLALWEKIETDLSKRPRDSFEIAQSHHWLAETLMNINRFEEAEPHLREAVGLHEQRFAQRPTGRDQRESLAHVKFYMGKLLFRTGRPVEAEKFLREAIGLSEKLATDFPRMLKYRRTLPNYYRKLTNSLLALGRTKEAEEALRHSITLGEKLQREFPSFQYVPLAASATYDLGVFLYDTDRQQEGAAAIRRALEVSENLVAEQRHVSQRLGNLALVLATCPATQFRDPDRAIRLANKALQHNPVHPEFWYTLGAAQYRAGDWKAAIDALHKSMENFNGGDSRHWFVLAMAEWQLRDQDEAREWYDKAVAWMDQTRPYDQVFRRLRAEAEELLGIDVTSPEENEKIPTNS